MRPSPPLLFRRNSTRGHTLLNACVPQERSGVYIFDEVVTCCCCDGVRVYILYNMYVPREESFSCVCVKEFLRPSLLLPRSTNVKHGRGGTVFRTQVRARARIFRRRIIFFIRARVCVNKGHERGEQQLRFEYIYMTARTRVLDGRVAAAGRALPRRGRENRPQSTTTTTTTMRMVLYSFSNDVPPPPRCVCV